MKKKILVVDDDVDLLNLLHNSLELRGYEVFKAADGEEGLAIAKREKPDVIILDIMMPHTDGIQMSKALKSDQGAADIPIIFLTALKKPADSEQLDVQGPNIVLAKPVGVEALVEAIQRVLRRSRRG